MTNTIYDRDLDACAANFAALTPLDFLVRTAAIHPDRPALVHGPVRRTWVQGHDRCRRLASALAARGIGRGGRRGALIHTGQAGPDHPMLPQLAETGYLKALFFRLD